MLELYTGGIRPGARRGQRGVLDAPRPRGGGGRDGHAVLTGPRGRCGRQLRNYTLEELVHMQGRAVRHGEMGHFHLFCQAEDKDTYMRFLEGGLPLESQLLHSDQLRQWYKHHRAADTLETSRRVFRRYLGPSWRDALVSNPTYYDCKGTRDECLSES
jgi:antiviral helicase SLH1